MGEERKGTLSAEFFFDRYSGDWNALLRALFSADIKKVSHNVKDLMHTLLENGLPAEGLCVRHRARRLSHRRDGGQV